MKVTALLPEDLIREVRKASGGRNITESIRIALEDYISRQRLKKSMQKVKERPLKFTEDFTAEGVRGKNRES